MWVWGYRALVAVDYYEERILRGYEKTELR